ncbi:hypothetical protein G0Q06_04400 [Puniceicoccales bacterium CK1056]|uniref:Uncharacterized protein n=1 Tax=Oceanipulchritudo coccoides TaxID=2706888 RepID=A0A6B2LZ24_9BACT|nr:hypothetical protein [Oceanipulchritudo coccoides]NDV61683.1 hypothetical protein [Oceanipulchritudo coccoides]
MGSPVIAKIELWTEGLNENWGLDINNRRRIDRGRLNPAELRLIAKRVRKRNRTGAECLLILTGGDRYLEVHVNENDLLLSNPQDPNYQNVTIPDKDLKDYVEQYFTVSIEATPFEWTPSLVMQCITLLLVLLGLGVVLVFVSRHFSKETGFVQKPAIIELNDPIASASAIEDYSGIYATGMWDGAMLIELNIDSTFSYYDIKRSGQQRYILELVHSGTYKPVSEMGRMAFLTELNFIFYPDEEAIIFQDREYELIAQSRQDLPFIAFTD